MKSEVLIETTETGIDCLRVPCPPQIYSSENYQNNWQIKNASAGLYLYRLTLASEEVRKGKIVVVR